MTKDKLPCPVVITLHFVGQKPRSLLSLVTTYPWQANTLSAVPGTKYICTVWRTFKVSTADCSRGGRIVSLVCRNR